MPLRPRLLLLCLWGLLLQQAETDSEGQTTGELYQRWERYARECEETLTAADPPSGMVCNGSFDMYVCWDYTAANTTAQASCPWYLPWYRHVAAGYVFRQCGSDGQWGPWRDHTQCENPEKNGAFQDQRLILERLQVVYTVGYSLSLGTLLLALLILSLFRRLHCTRNYIHMNVFLSFMLRAVAILTRDRLLPTLGPYPGDRTLTLRNQALAACRTAQIVTQYCVGANYTWLLVEGVYLHHLLVIVGGSEKGHFRCYLLLGWGAPALFVIPWVIVRYLLENTQSISSSSSASLASLCQNSGRGRCAARTTDCGISGERALLLHQQRGRRGRPARAPWWPCRERRRPERPTLQVQSEIRRSWRHRVLHLSLRDERPCPHAELGPQALPSRSAPREVPITGSTLPSGPLHGPGEEVLESYC
ncbi:gastric inhibitory polypeptide receptor isoform X12 [Mesocricetus auratus]|uniref:Gastric inhibitory polypeptide receptor isoform X12 n=1 Tax=Mesocricetus auratus TaxID=10036 RepID=A0ABM2WHX3_MESAU|nr:gastric inhibitory polypeptide receptor isoform X12 [Mesocricetus auratus]